MRYIVIMAGGSGKRLWPLSRQGMPKQLLRLLDGQSLLRLAYERVAGMVPDEQILVCTGADYVEVVREELPELPEGNLLGEPEGRDSLNAVTWPAAVLTARDPEAVVAMLGSDHLMHPVDRFRAAVEHAFEVAEQVPDALVTFGVVPTSPHTGLGYLHRGEPISGHPDVFSLVDFREKPDRATAETYLASGDYWWNAGMFVWRTRTLLDQLERLLPDAYALITELTERPDRLDELFPQLPKISVDYAIMEPVAAGRASAHVLAVALPITWHDVGGFVALGEQLPTDAEGNASQGVTVLVDSRDNVVINTAADGRLVAVVGLTDTVIVQTSDITLVCPVSETERIKELLDQVTGQLGSRYA